MEKLRIGLVGCGRIAKNHIQAIANNQNMLELTAVSDIVPERMDAAVGLYSQGKGFKPRQFRDYQDLLAGEVDAVAIATESGNHAAIALDSLAAGKHLVVEKPLALSTDHCRQVIAGAQENNLTLAVCHQNRFNPAVQQLRQAVEAGRFGRIINGTASVRWNRNDNYYRQAPWRGTWAMDGGTLMNQCLHNIDLLMWMLGSDPATVYCQADTFLRPIEGEDFGALVIRFGNGAIGLVEGSACVYPTNLEETLAVFGEKGTVCLGGIAVNKITRWQFADGQKQEQQLIEKASQPDPKNVYGNGHNPLYRDFYQAVRDTRPPYIDGQAGLQAVELILAAYKSRRDGIPVSLPLDSFSTLDMKKE